MKKILALLVSLVLMCSSIGAVAEENYTTTLRFDLAMEELLMLSGAEFGEEEEAIADILLPLIEKLNFKLITADEQMQLSLAIDDASIASLTGGISGDQIVIVSDLFPSCYLSLSLETLESLMVEAAAVMPQIDANAEAAMEKAGAQISHLDGVRADFPDCWMLMRKSVTAEQITLRAEAKTEAKLKELLEAVANVLPEAARSAIHI